MPRIKTTVPKDATGELAEAYGQLLPRGVNETANIVSLSSIHPKSMAGQMLFYRTLMFGPSPLTRRQREMVATRVSQLNKCHY